MPKCTRLPSSNEISPRPTVEAMNALMSSIYSSRKQQDQTEHLIELSKLDESNEKKSSFLRGCCNLHFNSYLKFEAITNKGLVYIEY